ncbi:hypothetical protein CHS0354_033284, partial [Potamilus streckersoni]
LDNNGKLSITGLTTTLLVVNSVKSVIGWKVLKMSEFLRILHGIIPRVQQRDDEQYKTRVSLNYKRHLITLNHPMDRVINTYYIAYGEPMTTV